MAHIIAGLANTDSMRVLIGCERSGVIREAFRRLGHDAWSCDLADPTDCSSYHYKCDLRDMFPGRWDLFIVHPDCTYLSVSGLHWNKRRPERAEKTEKALAFVRWCFQAGEQWCDAMCLENPISCISTRIRKPDQIIQPWQFGEDASKATCLWLKNLPLLQPTNILPGGREARRANQTPSGQNKLGPSPQRAMERARTIQGIAEAMAAQWTQEAA